MSTITSSNDPNIKKLQQFTDNASKFAFDVDKTLETLQEPSAHYEVPNLSSMLYEYTNKEQEIVAACFRVGNYFNLRELPDELGPNNVIQALKEKLDKSSVISNLISQNKRNYTSLAGGAGVFQKFDWMPDQYYAKHESDLKDQEEFRQKQNALHKMPFIMQKIKRHEKYEYPFLGKDEQYTYTFLLQEDPYDATKDEILRSKWMEEARYLYGDFKPPGSQKPVEQVSKSRLQDIVETIKKMLLSDWNDVNFVIGTNPNDFIETKFDLTTVDTLQGLHAYMNTLINSNEEILSFCLKKVSHFWGYKEGNYVYYMLAPPWVRLIINDVVNQSRNSNDKSGSKHQIESKDTYQSSKKPTLYSKEININ